MASAKKISVPTSEEAQVTEIVEELGERQSVRWKIVDLPEIRSGLQRYY